MEFEEETSYAGGTYTGRIVKETKAGFLVGVLCGLFSYPVKGICNLPKNSLKPLLQACPQAALTNVPRLGGKFAAFTAVWSSLTCAIDHYQYNQYFQVPRLKTAVLSPAIGLTATVALFKSPRGFLVASRSAIRWGAVYAIFRGSYEIGVNVYEKYYFEDIRRSNMYQLDEEALEEED